MTRFCCLWISVCVLLSPLWAAPRSFSTRTLKITRRHYESKALYPVFRPANNLTQVANHILKQLVIDRQAAFTKAARETLREFTPPNVMGQELTFASGPFQGPRLISGRFEQYEFLGGVHPMTMTFCFNFGFVNGRARQLSLGDFFPSDKNYQKRITAALLNKLRYQKADWILEGVVSSFNAAQLNNFVAEKDGLRFYFDPYAVGPYAAGPYEVKLSGLELGSGFRLPA